MLLWKPWLDAVNFSFEVQSVMALRLLKIAAGGPGSSAEPTRVVTEKVRAVAHAKAADAVASEKVQAEADAQAADAVALAQCKGIKTARKRATAPIKRRVRADHHRPKGSET